MDEALNGMDCEGMSVARLRAADGELDQDERAAMNFHLERCPACRTEQEHFETIDRQLMVCGETADRQKATTSGRVQAWGWAEVAVAGVALIALAIWLPSWRPASRALPSTGFPSDGTGLSDGGEMIRVELRLSPAGSPFLDGLQSEPAVLVNVVVGADGLPVDVRLAPE